MTEKYLKPKEVEQALGIPEKTLANWRSQGKGPAYFKFGGKVRYALKDLEGWIRTKRIITVDCPG